MSVTVQLQNEEDSGDDAGQGAASGKESAARPTEAGQERVALEVTLWRADAVAAVIEVDNQLEVTRADAAAGLLFGISHRALLKRNFRK
jgi:hypothetical protein